MREGASILGTKWVYKVKGDGRHRARLVVKGYNQVPGVDYTESHSPVATDTSIRSLLVRATELNWDVEQIDVETAFLYGELKEQIYLGKPEGFVEFSGLRMRDDEVLLMKRAAYGLVQASRAYL